MRSDSFATPDTASLTARRLNRATLARQLLLGREPLDVVEAVHRLVGLQAQEPASPYVALWNRLTDLEPADVDRAFADHSLVKATLMRITLHAVASADYPAFHEAMQRTLRAARLNDARFRRTGLSSADAHALLPALVEFTARPRTNAEGQAWVTDRLGPLPEPGVWWAVRQFGPFIHAPTGGPWSFGPRPAYIAAPRQERPGDEDASLRYLVRRYLTAFGPASQQDFQQFALVTAPPARAAFEALADELVTFEGPNGSRLFDVADGDLPPEETAAPPRLLGMWDSVLLAYKDRSRIIPPEYRTLVARNNGDFLPTLLVDGYVAGVWRPVDRGVEATAFHPLPGHAWDGLAAEARALVSFLAGRESTIYQRYGRWWSDLPSAEVRVL